MDAVSSILSTTMLLVLLLTAAWLFTRDATNMVVQPVQRMVERVQNLADDPFSELRVEGVEDSKDEGLDDIKVLSRAVNKISRLLALGFGEAGRNVIKDTFGADDGTDLKIPGHKMHGIFWFCDIRNFTDITECLGKNVLVFTNTIAQLVHENVHMYDGAANKNIGDAFLCAWKLPYEYHQYQRYQRHIRKSHQIVKDAKPNFQDADDKVKNLAQAKSMYSRCPYQVQDMANRAFIALVKTKCALDRNPYLRIFERNSRILRRMPDYRVKLGYGLHVGWAIEGAIGSNYKIDATYLSPHVNIAARLESATKMYGVQILMSGSFYSLLTVEAQKLCRKVDRVTVKGSDEVLELYTVDVPEVWSANDFALDTSNNSSGLTSNDTTEGEEDPREHREIKEAERIRSELQQKDAKDSDTVMASKMVFQLDSDLLFLRQQRMVKQAGFYALWEKGMDSYVGGDWRSAYTSFKAAQQLRQEDGPCKTLLGVIEEAGRRAPPDWAGYRKLFSK